jgi:hypothetical protein
MGHKRGPGPPPRPLVLTLVLVEATRCPHMLELGSTHPPTPPT